MLYRNTWAAAKESNPLLRVWEKTSAGVGCKPQPETHLPYISQCPPLPHVQAIHLVLPLVACDPARKRSEDVFPCSFSHFFKEKREAEARRRWEEKWTPSCSLQGRLWRNKQLTLLTGGGERKVEPVCRSWIFLAPANPSQSNILSHLTPFAPLSETNCPLARSILPSLADLSPAASSGWRNRGTKKSKAQAETHQRRKIATGVTRSWKFQYHPGKRWE